MDSRLCFIAACLRGEEAMTSLCAHHGISRKTGYKWLARYQALGAAGLAERSSARPSQARVLAPSVLDPILSLRQARPSWGPRKLLARLAMDHPDITWPAASTVGDLLSREGLVTPRPRRRRKLMPCADPVAPLQANDSWSADFKGWFRTGDGVRCEPLTISDNFSRYLLVSHAVPRPTFDAIKPLFVNAFRENGLPLSLRTDNGSPFANRRGLAGLSRFSIWLLKLNIWPERIAPGRPDQNGRHERMHRTLKQDAATPTAPTISIQQDRLDAWRVDFNTNRPHEALGQRCPASVHRPSPRHYPETLTGWDHPADHHLRKVDRDGYIRWQDARLYLTEALIAEQVAIAQRDDGQWLVRFRAFDLAVIDAETGTLRCSGLSRSEKPGTT
jgi:transposase InsO family protein